MKFEYGQKLEEISIPGASYKIRTEFARAARAPTKGKNNRLT